MKILSSKKKFIYLISPNKIYPNFYKDLNKIFQLNKVNFFQLRLKKTPINLKFIIAKKTKKICKKFKIKFLINDDPYLAKKIGADGCHLGQKDINIIKARKILGKKIIGITCHNSIKLSKKAIKDGADYIALGAFNPTKTKNIKFKAKVSDLIRIKKISKIPIIAIGGINNDNYKKLLLNKVNFLAISSYVFNNKKFKPIEAIKMLK
ncbi:thiamine phosphate synthase [Candidatus Pelagibacter sp.]|nr:thiamine phosphate synthase [Candidatus Pelagibacter sp.]